MSLVLNGVEDARLDVGPISLVLVFLLHPLQLGVGESSDLLGHQVKGERWDLFREKSSNFCSILFISIIRTLFFNKVQGLLILQTHNKTYCTTPSKLVVYKPMGAERAADRTIAQSCSYVPFHRSAWCHNNFALHISLDLRDLIAH